MKGYDPNGYRKRTERVAQMKHLWQQMNSFADDKHTFLGGSANWARVMRELETAISTLEGMDVQSLDGLTAMIVRTDDCKAAAVRFLDSDRKVRGEVKLEGGSPRTDELLGALNLYP